MNIAILPARGGSKRIPQKNIRSFCGWPIIYYPIKTAIKSGCFDRIIVSTDDDEVAMIATQLGAEAPFRRPADLATDHAATLPVVSHALRWLQTEGCALAYVCCIYPATPMLEPRDLIAALELLRSENCSYCLSVTGFAHPVQRALKLGRDGRVTPMFPQLMQKRTQDLVDTWHDAGQFYWGTAAAFLQQRPIFGNDSVAYPMARYRAVDIDTPEDWQHAELLYKVYDQVRDVEQNS